MPEHIHDDMMRLNVRPPVRILAPLSPMSKRTAVRTDTGRSPRDREALHEKRLEVARTALGQTPTVGVRELAQRIAHETKRRISTSTASEIRDEVLAEIEQEQERVRERELVRERSQEQTAAVFART